MTPEIRTKPGEALLGGAWSRVAPFWAHDVRGSLNTMAIHLELMQAMTTPGTPEHEEIVKGAREIRTAIDTVTGRLADMERLATAARVPDAPDVPDAEEWAAVRSLAAIYARKRNRVLTMPEEPPPPGVLPDPAAISPVIGLLHLVLAAIDTADEGSALRVEARGDDDRSALVFTWDESAADGDPSTEFRDAATALGWVLREKTGGRASHTEITLRKGKSR